LHVNDLIGIWIASKQASQLASRLGEVRCVEQKPIGIRGLHANWEPLKDVFIPPPTWFRRRLTPFRATFVTGFPSLAMQLRFRLRECLAFLWRLRKIPGRMNVISASVT